MTKKDKIPSREWLLGWFEGYYFMKPKDFNYIKDESKDTLHEIYMTITEVK